MELLLEHLGKGFINTLIIAMPVVLTAASIGLVVGILQAVTQVQEQTIAAAPKILAVFLMIILMGGFFMKILSEYLTDAIYLALHVVPKRGTFVMSPYDELDYKKKKTFYTDKTPTLDEIMKNPGKVPYFDREYKPTYTKSSGSPSVNPDMVETIKINSDR